MRRTRTEPFPLQASLGQGRRAAPLALLLLGSGARAADGGPDLGALREEAREALRTTCGRCHDHGRPTARPAALRVFDLEQAEWSARITDVQIDHIVERFELFHMPEADRRTVQRFLDAERARRAALPRTASPDTTGG